MFRVPWIFSSIFLPRGGHDLRGYGPPSILLLSGFFFQVRSVAQQSRADCNKRHFSRSALICSSQPGRGRYLNVVPSKKAVQRERDRLRAMTGYSQSHKPLPRLIAELNRHLKGWGNYFCFGYPLRFLAYHHERCNDRGFIQIVCAGKKSNESIRLLELVDSNVSRFAFVPRFHRFYIAQLPSSPA